MCSFAELHRNHIYITATNFPQEPKFAETSTLVRVSPLAQLEASQGIYDFALNTRKTRTLLLHCRFPTHDHNHSARAKATLVKAYRPDLWGALSQPLEAIQTNRPSTKVPSQPVNLGTSRPR